MKKTNKKVTKKDLEVKGKELNTEIKEVIEKVFEENALDKIFTNITKLKCNYSTYKKERTKYSMPVEKECAKCGKKFKEDNELYVADAENKQVIICKKCANNDE